MRILGALLVSFTLLTTSALGSQEGAKKFDYQSDVARLRKIVINSLYSHRDVFLRELISNANDALEKLRLTSLVDKDVLGGAEELNITIRAFKEEDGTAKLVIRDTGIGMTPEEMATNLGTLAKSGTSEFLARAESTDTANTGNLIGAFGLGFYSSFLVADQVYVSSLAAPSSKNPNPVQYVFSSSADESSFEVYPDERGNFLGRGTEITLVLKEDAETYLDIVTITELVTKHSSFSTTFPIYLFTQRTEEVPVEEEETFATEATEESTSAESDDEDEAAVVEDVGEEEDEEKEVKTKEVVVDEWVHLNSQAPIWMRDPKSISNDEYEQFYTATFKDYMKPMAWHHFTGDTGAGTTFRAILFVPAHLDDDYWRNPLQSAAHDIRLMVKGVFITSDFGEDALPKWATWVKVVVDADDLPLNVSRETLQSTRFLKQLQSIIIKRLIQTLQRIREHDDENELEAWQMHEIYNNVFKLGAVEDRKNGDKLAALVKFPTNQRNETTLDEYLENRKEGQKQIFYLADMGKSAEELAKSVFVEKLNARGYEVLLLGEALDEVFVQNVARWKKFQFQDVAKAGLKFGDEDDDEQEQEQLKAYAEEFKPLLSFLKNQTEHILRDVIVSSRLVTSPCAIVADAFGYTANMERLLHSQQESAAKVVHDYAKKLKVLEINPRSPLIQGMLKRVQQLPSEEEEPDIEAEEELKEVTTVLVDSALVRSGFEVSSANDFFQRMDRILRRSLGVSEDAPTDATVKPAPPVASEPVEEQEFDFDDSHMRLDPELLGLKVGEPVLFDDEKAPQDDLSFEVVDDSESEAAQKPFGHDEL